MDTRVSADTGKFNILGLRCAVKLVSEAAVVAHRSRCYTF